MKANPVRKLLVKDFLGNNHFHGYMNQAMSIVKEKIFKAIDSLPNEMSKTININLHIYISIKFY